MSGQARRKWPWRIAGIISFALLVAAVVISITRAPDRLTKEKLEAAKEKWRRTRLENYDLEIEIRSQTEARYLIRVRDGGVKDMKAEGASVGPRGGHYWTVDGLFAFLETEMANAKEPEKPYGVQDPSQVVLRAEFDPERGAPVRFMRHVLGRDRSVRWEILRLEPVSGKEENP